MSSMQQSPTVSVIIPVYNAEKHLRACLDSIAAESTSFEAILIDDGSTDESHSICDEYATRDSRFRVFHIDNGGPASARNYGLNQAIGQWITFVDSDDVIESEYLSIPNRYPDADLIYASFTILSADGNYSIRTWGKESEWIVDKKRIENLRLQVFDPYSDRPLRKLGFTCGKFFKRHNISSYNIFFPVGLLFYEDACFTWEYFKHVKSVCFVDDTMPRYIYRINTSSLTQKVSRHLLERRKQNLIYVDINVYDSMYYEAFGRFYIDQFLFATNTISQSAKSIPGLFVAMASLYEWPVWKRILLKGLFFKGFKPLNKQYFIIASRLAYLFALKKYIINFIGFNRR